jgi:hypothetical protein
VLWEDERAVKIEIARGGNLESHDSRPNRALQHLPEKYIVKK